MRIGLVTGEYPPMEGGVGAFTDQLARAMDAQGHKAHIITSRLARPADAPRKPAALFEPNDLGYAMLHPRINRWRWPSLSTIAEIVIRYDLEVVSLQYQAAAYNMNSAAINFLPWRLKSIVPVVTTFHDLRVPYLFPKAGGLRGRAVRMLARRSRGCIATNQADAAALESYPAAAVRTIPIGSNIDTYIPNHVEIDEVRRGLRLGVDDILIAYFGFLNESKGADVLLRALAQLDERYHLVFVGGQTGDSDRTNNADFLAQLQSKIEALYLTRRVHWTGFLSPVRVSSHLVAADVVALPYRDGASLRRGTLMAALAHGCPLITTTPVDPTPELVHGDNVLLVPPEDDEALAGALRQMTGDPALRNRLGSGALALSAQFGWDSIARQTIAFYETMTAHAGEGSGG